MLSATCRQPSAERALCTSSVHVWHCLWGCPYTIKIRTHTCSLNPRQSRAAHWCKKIGGTDLPPSHAPATSGASVKDSVSHCQDLLSPLFLDVRGHALAVQVHVEHCAGKALALHFPLRPDLAEVCHFWAVQPTIKQGATCSSSFTEAASAAQQAGRPGPCFVEATLPLQMMPAAFSPRST